MNHTVWEFRGSKVSPHSTQNFQDLQSHLKVPTMPPNLAEVCKLIDIYYVLKVCLGMEKSGEDLDMEFPVDIATVPYRISNQPAPELTYGEYK